MNHKEINMYRICVFAQEVPVTFSVLLVLKSNYIIAQIRRKKNLVHNVHMYWLYIHSDAASGWAWWASVNHNPIRI